MTKPIPRYSEDVRLRAKQLFLKGWAIEEIAANTSISERTIYKWRKDEGWDAQCPPDTVEIFMSRRLIFLTNLEEKTPAQLAEYTVLTDSFCKVRRAEAEAQKILAEASAIAKGIFPVKMKGGGGGEERTGKGGREKKIKNDISSITEEMLDEVFDSLFYGYQKVWKAAKENPLTRRIRFILKSRQIGATFYFAFEALDDAIRTGDNQLFLSASRDQAEVFKSYIIAFAKKYFDVELKGDGCITLSNGAELRFLSTNSNTAQSYHGHLYRDECFWVNNYKKMRKVSSGMAAHKKWRITDVSTPSATSHEAYPYWSGEVYNADLPEAERIDFDISHAALKDGWLGPDGTWRHMVNIEDAEAAGCDLFDIAQLKREYSKPDFANLFMCKFIDDSQSVFNLQMMLNCTVEKDDWDDYDANKQRPFANKEVALGYDPSRVGDNAALAILATPTPGANYWRVLRTENYKGSNFQDQAEEIKRIKDSHNVAHIGIDKTGMGLGLYELVEGFFPLVTPINYSVEVKTQLVVKALDVIANGRFRYLVGNSDITRSFMMITKKVTSNNSITYASNRSEKSGHADVAWSIMHALKHEQINYNRATTTVS